MPASCWKKRRLCELRAPFAGPGRAPPAEGRDDPAGQEDLLGVRAAHPLDRKGPGQTTAGTPVELGVPVCVIEDQYPFILGHTILWEGGDRDGIVPCIQTLQEHYPTLQTLSLDKGFWSPTVYEALSATLDLVALPKKGRPTAVERAREQTPEFTAARQPHPAIESAINMLEHHGLQRIRSFGADGFARRVGISIIAANLVRVGRLLRDKERARLERQHRRRAA